MPPAECSPLIRVIGIHRAFYRMWSQVIRSEPHSPSADRIDRTLFQQASSPFFPLARISRSFEDSLPGRFRAIDPLSRTGPLFGGNQHILANSQTLVVALRKDGVAGVRPELRESLVPILGFNTRPGIACNLLNLGVGCDSSDVLQEERFNAFDDALLRVFSDHCTLPNSCHAPLHSSIRAVNALSGIPRAAEIRCILTKAMFRVPLSTSPRYVRWMPASSASLSCERPLAVRNSLTASPKARFKSASVFDATRKAYER